MQLTMYHNPRCSTCRKVLESLKARGAQVTTIEYLVHPPNAAALRRLLQALNMTARELLRAKEELYTTLGLGDVGRSEEELLAAMAAHPKLIQRPIVLWGERAVLARPPEKVAELFSELSDNDSIEYPDFAQQLIAMQAADLAMRNRLIAQGELGGGYHPQMEALHGEHAVALQRIIDSIGYPSPSKVGKEASEAAWLVVQHSISHPEFMRRCRAYLEKAARSGEANAALHLAYLSDRIAVLEGRPQLYGTQFDWDQNAQMSPNQVDNPERVNQRRLALGLKSLEEQTSIMRTRVESENQAPPVDYAIREREQECWRRRAGWVK